MTPGPLRRLIGTLGLLALAPTAVMLAMDRITPLDAALRSCATLLAAVLIGRVADWWVAMIAQGLESPDPDEGEEASDEPRRRRDDARQGAGADPLSRR